jgi:hypothetical protein
MDDAGIPALQDAIRHMYGLAAKWLETVAVHETFRGKTVWKGSTRQMVFAVDLLSGWRDRVFRER